MKELGRFTSAPVFAKIIQAAVSQLTQDIVLAGAHLYQLTNCRPPADRGVVTVECAEPRLYNSTLCQGCCLEYSVDCFPRK